MPLEDLRAHVLEAHDLIRVLHLVVLLDLVVLGQPFLPVADGRQECVHRRLFRVVERATLVTHRSVSSASARVRHASPGLKRPCHPIRHDHRQRLSNRVCLEVLAQLLLKREEHFLVFDAHLQLDVLIVLHGERLLGLVLHELEQLGPAPIASPKEALEVLSPQVPLLAIVLLRLADVLVVDLRRFLVLLAVGLLEALGQVLDGLLHLDHRLHQTLQNVAITARPQQLWGSGD